jgi:hypothetical protein
VRFPKLKKANFSLPRLREILRGRCNSLAKQSGLHLGRRGDETAVAMFETGRQ